MVIHVEDIVQRCHLNSHIIWRSKKLCKMVGIMICHTKNSFHPSNEETANFREKLTVSLDYVLRLKLICRMDEGSCIAAVHSACLVQSIRFGMDV